MQNSKFLSKFKEKIKALNVIREKNKEKYSMAGIILLVMFPLFITSVIEIIQMQSAMEYLLFAIEKPTIVVFNVIIATIILFGFLLLFKKSYIAVFVEGVFLTILSIVELFKFGTSGVHFTITDLIIATNTKAAGDMQGFMAYINISPLLVFCVLLVLGYIFAVFYFNYEIKVKIAKRITGSVAIFALFVTFLLSPMIATPVYSFFEIDTTSGANYVDMNDKFENNSFLAFLTQTTTEQLGHDIEEPDNYSRYSIQTLVDVADEEVPTEVAQVKPNVITIMSEAFADFRVFEELYIDGDIYADFDTILEDSFYGETVVPTFAGFTVKTEFELLFGLPIRSLNDVNMPQNILLEQQQTTIVSQYNDLGYNTNYIHTFDRYFYERDEIYSNFGFDNMIFEDNMTVELEYYRDYISDKTIFNQVNELITNTDEPVFVHTTTMQNHQPYQDEMRPQIDIYFEGVELMLADLKAFLEELEKIDEPTIVLFVGDHFPSMGGIDSVYDNINLYGNNSDKLYNQTYFIWDNMGLDYSNMPEETVSSFYLPHLLLETAGLETNEVSTSVLERIDYAPVYTSNHSKVSKGRDDILDTITYDIVLGAKYTLEIK